ncbi:outer membrane protein [Phreatobacter oligotrophus]|uniref:Outer membrane immunogenic protein n=1 Tax=Phreatobacter oligotrophus TaxID=1122261 RepID=A0A2T4Z182_9HYPH|nr:outer membrane protein [Phreatobacter oligotrophus]PTM53496.1 outer membrane immunogenic protein [Phreatobacter oligotrophus]
MKKLLLATTALVAFAAGAQAADLGVPRSPVAAAVVAPAFNWTGFYLGAHLGAVVNQDRVNIPGYGALGLYTRSPTSLMVGGQLGYNYQVNNVVFGLEADLSYLAGSRTGLSGNGGAELFRVRPDYNGSIRGRLGFAADRALFYVTGGVAFHGLTANFDLPFNGPRKYNYVGGTVGAGVEYAVTNNWSVRGEYLYGFYGTKTAVFNGPVDIRPQTHTFRVGVNYLFSTGPSAVVARY